MVSPPSFIAAALGFAFALLIVAATAARVPDRAGVRVVAAGAALLARDTGCRRRRHAPGRPARRRTTLVSCAVVLCRGRPARVRDRLVVQARVTSGHPLRGTGRRPRDSRVRRTRASPGRPLHPAPPVDAHVAPRGARAHVDANLGSAGLDLRSQGKGGAGEFLGHVVRALPAGDADVVGAAGALRGPRPRRRLSIARRS